MLATAKTTSRKTQKCLKPHGTSGFRHYGVNGHCIKDGMNIDKRTAYLIQVNEKENSPKALEIRGFGDFVDFGRTV